VQPLAVRIIKDEHVAISAVLVSLRLLVRKIREEGGAPDFRLFYAMMELYRRISRALASYQRR